ncbi:CHAT domain-containing protein [Pseudoduganella sp. SL102]|uniref:CHAT domain-containing protein n=1 Tax=Pseudoduganella sp. SL102 TaxID=2995154 RepID=UPI00248D2DA9|nr:CHAT domain-containing protein [Pseudoduganella sp. SL102]WBS04959.1 CHAT domain-containing protein [Pseudoduganella sp. SL102]
MKILFLGANPVNAAALDIEDEVRAISEAIQSSLFRDEVTFIHNGAVDAAMLLQSLEKLKPDVVHFSGHGADGQIALRYGDDYRMVKPEMLVRVLKRYEVKLLVLNCCYSIQQEQALAGAALSVIGTTAAIKDKTAVEFAKNFYRNLCDGYRVDHAYYNAQIVVDLNQGEHSPFHRIGSDTLRFFHGKQAGTPEDSIVLPPGISRMLGSIHLHIDGGTERKLVRSAMAAHRTKGYLTEQNAVTQFIAGGQRNLDPEMYALHTPGIEKEELDYFSTTCLHSGPDLPEPAQWQKIKAATREVLVQLDDLETPANTSGVVLELERVVGTVDEGGNVELADSLRLRDSDVSAMFDGEGLLFKPNYRTNWVGGTPLYELHFSLDLDRSPDDREPPPLELQRISKMSEQAALAVGGWFLFDDKRRWAYRSNGFEPAISKELLAGCYQRFKEVLNNAGVSRLPGYRLRLIAEEAVAVWKSPLRKFPDVYTVSDLARWEAGLDQLEEFWVVAPNFLGDQDGRVFEAMHKQLRKGARYIYFLRSNADARRWISFRADLKERLQMEPKMDAYVFEFDDAFWDTNMTFIANPRSKSPLAMRLLTDRLTQKIIGGLLDSGPLAIQLVGRLQSALRDPHIRRCERVIIEPRHDKIAAVCLRFLQHPAEPDWEQIFDDLLAKQVSVSRGEIVRYGGHTIVVLFVGARCLQSGVAFARGFRDRLHNIGPAWQVRLGIGYGDGQQRARADGMSWCADAIHDAKETTWAALPGEPSLAVLTPQAYQRLKAVGMATFPDLDLCGDAALSWITQQKPKPVDGPPPDQGARNAPLSLHEAFAATEPVVRTVNGADTVVIPMTRIMGDGGRNLRNRQQPQRTRFIAPWREEPVPKPAGSPPEDAGELAKARQPGKIADE